MAYADVYNLMSMTEELVSGLVKHIHGSYKTKFHTVKGEVYEVNWEAPWRRIDMMPFSRGVHGREVPSWRPVAHRGHRGVSQEGAR